MSTVNWNLLTDANALARLGTEIKRMRLERNLSQGEVAKNTGLDRSTIARLEGGRAATLLTVVQVLRALDRLQLLDPWVAEPPASPYMLVEAQAKYLKKQRKRAGRKKPDVLPPKPKSTW